MAGVCLLLWLTEAVPVWLPTIILWVTTALLLGPLGPEYRIDRVVLWSADPILILFLGGFSLAAAAHRQGADVLLASRTIRAAAGRPLRLVALMATATAILSMWMSNVAAAAMMLGALQPVLANEQTDMNLKRAVLLAVAMGANVGGIATPIGSGPNGIAMAAVHAQQPINFVGWMTFGVPLTFGLVFLVVAVIAVLLRPSGVIRMASVDAPVPRGRIRSLAVVSGITVALWLSEPLHGVPAWMTALGAMAALLAFRLVVWSDLVHLDWSTVLLVAGGIGLGALLNHSGLVKDVAALLPLGEAPPRMRLIVLCLASGILASLMSNTGTAALLIPLAATFDPSPATAIIVAVSASLGAPFVISTPPNAMAVAQGLPARDLIVPGVVLLIVGCLVVALTGPWVLAVAGIP